MSPICLLSITHRDLSPSEIIALCIESGIDGIEWGGDLHVPHGDLDVARIVGEASRQSGLSVVTYGSYYKCGRSEAMGLSFEDVLNSADALGAPVIRVWAGNTNFEETDDATRMLVLEDLHRVCEMAARKGIEIALEYHAGTLNNSPDGCRYIFEQVQAPNLKTLWQTTNGADDDYILDTIRAIKDRISHIHVFNWDTGPQTQTLLAEGELRWSRFLDELCSLPGKRFFCLEFVKDGLPENTRKDAETLSGWLQGRLSADAG